MFDTLASPLAGALVTLEPLEQRHLDDLRAAASDPRVSRWLPVPLHEPRWFDWWREWPDVRANLRRRLAALAA